MISNDLTVQSTDVQGDPLQSNIELKSRKRKLSFDQHIPSKHFKPLSVSTNFLNVKDQLQHILQSCDTSAMLEKCASLMASDTNNIPLFSRDFLETLKECKLAGPFIQRLAPYFNWCDHSILAAVVESCNNSDASKLLDKFDSQVDFSLPITEYPIPQPFPIMVPYDTSTHTVLAGKLHVELSKFSLQNLFDIRSLLQDTFKITPHAFQLLAAKKSSTILYWTIPKNIVSLITSNITQQSSHLHENGILELSVYPGSLFVTSSSLQVGSFSFFTQVSELVRKKLYFNTTDNITTIIFL